MKTWDGWDLPFLDESHKELIQRLQSWIELDERDEARVEALSLRDQCAHYRKQFAELGLLDLVVPSPTDPSNRLDVRSICLAREALSYRNAMADFVLSMQGIGTAAIWLFGTDRQKGRYLAPCREGRTTPAIAITEPDGGSDVAATRTTAEKRGDRYVINGAKSWISNGGIADHYIVFARTGEADGARGISAFLIDADTPGLRTGPNMDIIAPHPLSELFFEDLEVSASQLLGKPGEGFKVAMATLDIFRTSVGAAAVGLGRRAIGETIARMQGRQLFGKPMAELDLVRTRVADMVTDLDTAALTVYRAAWLKDIRDGSFTPEVAMAKLVGTEAGQRILDSAVQLFGAAGLRTGSVIERMFREIRPMRIYEGASEVQRLIIGRRALATSKTH
ncbi:acyl-CoA dehydrogenase family protein [Rhizobium leguminosarum]|uniref:acyl-CoA dehydrogenase family protein n=1 Tax=Rhizobium leguminosarum TaxID=384 RepID=UPI0024A94AF0|nr:acyl-CoA dehydrogenase family protein [Rhizobium leguminosarum]MDI5929681.1 acyl-CoA dehydrogenase family protein [Rhizobium leguminosarum]